MNKDVMFSHKSDEWSTPQDLFDKLNHIFHFTLDPCASKDNYKCVKYYTTEEDGLTKEWGKECVFVNPPYSQISQWVKYCKEQYIKHGICIVVLIPARTDTKYFHDHIFNGRSDAIVFIKGRLKFGLSRSCNNPAPFPSCVVIYGLYGNLPTSVSLNDIGQNIGGYAIDLY